MVVSSVILLLTDNKRRETTMNPSIAHLGLKGLTLNGQALTNRFRAFRLLSDSADQAARQAFQTALQELLELYVTWLLGRPKGAAPNQRDHACVSWRCSRCGSQTRRHFVRNGHYRRGWATHWGHVSGIRVPMVRCQRCGGYVCGEFPFVGKYLRLWDDLWAQALLDGALGLSLRQQIERQSAQGLWPSGLPTLNRQLNAGVRPLLLLRDVHLEEVPPLVQFDGIYFPGMERTATTKRDARRRLRRRLRRRQRVALVALGLWPDGRHRILAWAVADQESEAAWRDFLWALYERGLTPAAGLRLAIGDGAPTLQLGLDFIYHGQVPFQLCHFHKIQRLVHRDYLGDRAHRGQLLQDASEVLAGASPDEAERRLQAFSQKWQESEPRSVQCFRRHFSLCLTYFQVGDLDAAQYARTTSHAERLMRELRRKIRHLGPLVTDVGAEAALALLIARLNARWAQEPWFDPLMQKLLEAA